LPLPGVATSLSSVASRWFIAPSAQIFGASYTNVKTNIKVNAPASESTDATRCNYATPQEVIATK
jgi:hypothetical protein